uniref:Uncharacterized protein n=1 Tax=Arundo donax TaxID=35708 RepID=A0A0A8XQM9_ARUDO
MHIKRLVSSGKRIPVCDKTCFNFNSMQIKVHGLSASHEKEN